NLQIGVAERAWHGVALAYQQLQSLVPRRGPYSERIGFRNGGSVELPQERYFARWTERRKRPAKKPRTVARAGSNVALAEDEVEAPLPFHPKSSEVGRLDARRRPAGKYGNQ